MVVNVAAESMCWQCNGTGAVANGHAQCAVCHGNVDHPHRNVCFQVQHSFGAWDESFVATLGDLDDGTFKEWALQLLLRSTRYETTWPPSFSTIVESLG